MADSHLAMILDTARCVPKLWRDRWLLAVVDYLVTREIDDTTARAALAYADEKMQFRQ